MVQEPTSTPSLWNPVDVGAVRLPHRLAMAPMTRSRSTPAGTPTGLNAEYYRQRASTALIITEGAQPSADGQGYLLTPGIHTEEQVAGWRHVTDAVHAAGGQIVIQLMHTGRIAHPDNTPHGRQPVAPSAVQPKGQIFTAAGMKDMPEPRALATEEVRQTVADFAAAAVADAIGPERAGIQISPGNDFNDILEDGTATLYRALVSGLAPLRLGYLNIAHQGNEQLLAELRRLWSGALVLNRAGADIARRAQDIDDGVADVVTFGRHVLANPDYVERVRAGAPLNEPDPATFYGGDERGYTDYPVLGAS